jgi:hypothetical protein
MIPLKMLAMMCAKKPKQRASHEAIYEVCQEYHAGEALG